MQNSSYEVVFIVKPDAAEETLKGVLQKVRDTIGGLKGEVAGADEWGKRQFAYLIRNYQDGYYFLVTFSGAPSVPKEVERTLRLNENVLRYQTVRIIREKSAAAT